MSKECAGFVSNVYVDVWAVLISFILIVPWGSPVTKDDDTPCVNPNEALDALISYVIVLIDEPWQTCW